jgi:acyl-[acyl carrier protein]--UDP-N-acetylglucosamine O-acyltransferase
MRRVFEVDSDLGVGDHSHVNVGTTISHDCTIGSFVSLAPSCPLAGGVAAMVDDLPAHCTAIGVPA